MTQLKQDFWGARPPAAAAAPAPAAPKLPAPRVVHYAETQQELLYYTPQDVEAILQTERERLAAMVRAMCDYTGGHGEPRPPTGREIADAISKGTP